MIQIYSLIISFTKSIALIVTLSKPRRYTPYITAHVLTCFFLRIFCFPLQRSAVGYRRLGWTPSVPVRLTHDSSYWSWRKSSTSTGTWRGEDASRLPSLSDSRNGRSRFGFRTAAWSGRKTTIYRTPSPGLGRRRRRVLARLGQLILKPIQRSILNKTRQRAWVALIPRDFGMGCALQYIRFCCIVHHSHFHFQYDWNEENNSATPSHARPKADLGWQKGGNSF